MEFNMIALLDAYSDFYQQKPSTHLEFLLFLDEKADIVYNGQTLKTYLQILKALSGMVYRKKSLFPCLG